MKTKEELDQDLEAALEQIHELRKLDIVTSLAVSTVLNLYIENLIAIIPTDIRAKESEGKRQFVRNMHSMVLLHFKSLAEGLAAIASDRQNLGVVEEVGKQLARQHDVNRALGNVIRREFS